MKRYIGVLAAIVVASAVVYQYPDRDAVDDQVVVAEPALQQVDSMSERRLSVKEEPRALLSPEAEQTEEASRAGALEELYSGKHASDEFAANRVERFHRPLGAAQLDDEPFAPLSEEEKVRYEEIVSAYDEKVKVLSEAFEENLKNPEMRIEIEAKMAELQKDVNVEQYREAVIKLTKDQLATFRASGSSRAEQVISNAPTAENNEHRVQ